MSVCLSLAFLLLGSSARLDDPREFEVYPSILRWEDLNSEVFDRGWILPEARTVPGRDLLAEMRRLLELRFDVLGPNDQRLRCFGDLVRVYRSLEPDLRAEWYAGLASSAPGLVADWGAGMSELLFDTTLQSESWKPSKDYADDGLLFADPWPMGAEPTGPWSEIGVKPLMEQAAALVFADLASIKAVENDYRTYPQHVGADYREIYPLDDSYFIGKDAAGQRFSTLTIQFRCDLPFPFSSYSTRLKILNRFDAAGVLHTDIYSKSSDFHWLAGRDVFLPLNDSEGRWLGFLLVRHFGFDLDGVPDGPENRREAIRSSLGNQKRKAELSFSLRMGSDAAARNQSQVLNGVRVYGAN